MIRESMMNLAMSQVMVGANFWDAPGHSMAGSNDLPTQKENLLVDSGAREDVLPAAIAGGSDRRLLLSGDAKFLCGRISLRRTAGF